MSDCMTFPDDWREFLRDFSFKDTEEIYTNGCELIPVFRVEQLIEHLELLKEQNDNIGHWVVLENCSNAGVYCSECQTKIFDRYPMKKKYSYFCPHCGTRMEGQVVKWENER